MAMNHDQLARIGSNLKAFRRSKGLTQAQVGALTEIDRQTVSDIERGKFTGSLRTLMRYLRYANLELTATPAAGRFPNLEELAERYGSDDD
jgi:transcriptional regulator with XRE-family HTH domain